MKVAVYAICRDEAKFAERFARSCEGADLVSVADTGSADDSVDRLRASGAVVHSIAVRPWRFDAARNQALALVPDDIDVCISLDLDEVLLPGWRNAIDRAWHRAATLGTYRFILSRDASGRPIRSFRNSRIHARHGYRWRYACHESLYSTESGARPEIRVEIDGLAVEHLPDRQKDRSFYLELLERAFAEDPRSAYIARYLGMELARRQRWAEAEQILLKSVTLGHRNHEANAQGMRSLARCCKARGDPARAGQWLVRAVETAPEIRDGWIELAEHCHSVQDWHSCYAAAARALAIPFSLRRYPNNFSPDDPLPNDLAAVSAWNLGLVHEAHHHAERAYLLCPSDDRLRENLRAMVSALSR